MTYYLLTENGTAEQVAEIDRLLAESETEHEVRQVAPLLAMMGGVHK